MNGNPSASPSSSSSSSASPSAGWARDLRVNQHLDVLDTTNKWTEAVAIGLSQHKVHVHYRGWSPKFNEWLAFESPRLAPAYARVSNWRATLHKGARVQLGTDVNGVKTPVWRDGTVRQVRRGDANAASAPAKVQVQVDGSRELRWVDAHDDALSAPRAHAVPRKATTRRQQQHADEHDGDDEKDNASSDDHALPETIILSDDDSGSLSAQSSSSEQTKDAAGRKTRSSSMATRAKNPLPRPASKSMTTRATTPTPLARRDDRTKLPAVRKRKHDHDDRDDDDFATWREQLASGALVEVADAKCVQWYEARVCDVRGAHQVCVRFRGWPWRYDEWLPRTSARLAPPAVHLGRWREFQPDHHVQIGFRASSKHDAPSHWLRGTVCSVSKSVKTRQVRRIEVEYTDDDGQRVREWRDAQDDFLAPMGVPTYPLPKSDKRETLRGSSGGSGGGGALAVSNGMASEDDDDNEEQDGGVDTGVEMMDVHEVETTQETTTITTTTTTTEKTLSDMFGPLTPDDIAEVIASQPPTEPLELSSPTTRAVAPMTTATPRTQMTQAKQQLDALQTQMAAMDTLHASMHASMASLASTLAEEANEPDGETQSNAEAARSVKRARRMSAGTAVETETGSHGGSGGDGGGGNGGEEDGSAAATLPADSPTTPPSRHPQPAEI